ncbi:hypothetical protein AB0395_26870 [Streptosporangium sp. NPDC051023]|uniref:hypothetical protein n=1 Tax=Streptosporangium sp. NPDC051023 TaxID=3155410 RepID=UPI00344B6D24
MIADEAQLLDVGGDAPTALPPAKDQAASWTDGSVTTTASARFDGVGNSFNRIVEPSL